MRFFSAFSVAAVQQSVDVIRVPFPKEESALIAVADNVLRLLDLWCRADCGPPATIVHVLDYPFQAADGNISGFLAQYSTGKKVRLQKHLSNDQTYT